MRHVVDGSKVKPRGDGKERVNEFVEGSERLGNNMHIDLGGGGKLVKLG